jgi:hypothetical protein
MRRAQPASIATLAASASLLTLSTWGCFSSSSSGGPPTNFTEPDSGTSFDSGAPVDSSVADVAADVTVDSSVPEASVDSSPIGADTGTLSVTVVVTNASGPEPGVTVAFQDATGNVLSSELTGTAGTASSVALDGSQVTVVMGTPALPYLFTIQGVAPGDVLAVYDPSADVPYVLNRSQLTITSVPSAPSGTEDYALQTGGYYYGGIPTTEGFPDTVTPYVGSVVGGEVSVLVTAVNPSGNSYTWQKGIALSDDGGGASAAFTGSWDASANNLAVTGANVPTFAQGFRSSESLSMVVNGVPYTQAYNGGFAQDDAGLYWPFTYPAGFADSVQVEDNVANFGSNLVYVSAIASRSAPTAGDAGVTLDLSQLLPPMTGASIDRTNPSQPIVTWSPTDAGALAGSDGVVIALAWGYDPSSPGSWTIVAPPTATQVQVPLLPASAGAFTPDGGTSFAFPTVAFVHATFLGSYPALRAQAGTAGLTTMMVGDILLGGGGFLTGQPIVPPLSANGTLVMSAATQQGD